MTPVRNHPLCTLHLSLALLLAACCCDVHAARLVSVDILDREYLVVNISDGDVIHQDEVNKVEQVLRYTPELDKSAAALTGNWTISSADDSGYGPDGRTPLSCSRKTKLSGHAEMGWSGNDYVYQYTYEHWIYLQLPSPLQQGASYQLSIDASINSDTVSESFTFDVFNSISEAIHVNLVGYSPDAPHKAADLYHWLGSGGPRDYSSFEGNTVYLHNVATGTAQAVGTVQFWKQSGTDVFYYNLTGSDVWTIDFSGATMPGTYRLAVDGVGCSQDFEIAEDAYHAPYAVSLLGYFYMRIGESNPKNISPPPRTPLYIPNQSPADTTVYLTTMQPYHPNWSTFTDGDKWDKPTAWVPYVKSTPSTTNPNAWGGHSDAADWDRHLGHVANIYDLLLPYLMSDGAIDDDDLGITESGNGIPDIIDEARNEVDFWLRLRDGAGYSHGLTNPNGSNELFQAGPTPIAAWANAANAAMLADAFRIAGRSDLMNDYQDAAAEAYSHASSLADQMLDEGLDLDDGRLRGRDLKMMAAAFLYNVTGDTAYEDAVFSESVCSGGPVTLNNAGRNQLYGTAAYLTTPRPVHYPALQDAMRSQIVAEAKSTEADLINTRPSRRATYNPPGYWRTAHFVTRTIIAHAVTESPSDKDYFRTALNLEADWSLGRNPLNMIEMTTATTVLASKRSVQESYTSGRYDGVPGVHPGHTPYMNLDDWSPGMTMGSPSKLMQNSYPADVLATWPRGETYYPSRWVWAHNEFTPRQTMRGKMALYGYLAAIAEPAGPPVAVTGVSLNPEVLTVNGSDSSQLTATIAPADATNRLLDWESSDPAVAAVDAGGRVRGVSPGSATVTVTTVDGGFTDTADITVTSPTVGRVIRVMPLGDSITEGYTIPGGYRLKFWQNLENDGLDCGVDLVGTLNNNSVAGLDDPDHEGHSGWTTAQILAGIDSYLAAATPDVVMMHLGTNDIAQDTVAEAPANLRGLIDHICAALPADGRLYVAKIIPMGGVGNPDSLAYNDMIVAAVTEKQSEGVPVYLVDAAAIWTNDLYSGDWTHPNQQGYDALGDFWFDVMRDDVQLSCGGVVTLPGDVNNDRSVDLADAISALKVLTGSQTGAVKEADVNGDDVIGMEEAVYILQRESTPP